MIHEVIISTVSASGEPHVTPFGIQRQHGLVRIAPYRPSQTLENILATKCAVLNVTDDVRAYAASLAGKPHGCLSPAMVIPCMRMQHCLNHQELQLERVDDDATRPALWMRVVHAEQHRPFAGFNRAQAAVIELAVLVSRLHMLPKDKILTEKAYLQIAIDKTAGDNEREAWQWLCEKIANFYQEKQP